tara:strand:- start:145 stop:501 length:357 start_codon:yes stop_codon:yes gene_type:complete
MSTQLKSGRNWTNRVRVQDEKPKLDKKNPLHAAVMGQMIRNIKNNNFDDIANLQIAADVVDIPTDDGSKVVIGFYRKYTLQEPNSKETLTIEDDDAMANRLVDQGYKVVSCEKKDILG